MNLDADVARRMDELLHQLKPVSADFAKALKHYADATREHDQALIELMSSWTRHDNNWHRQLELIDKIDQAVDRQRELREKAYNAASAYHPVFNQAMALMRIAAARATVGMFENPEDEDEVLDALIGMNERPWEVAS